jgi:hypothetical protein
MLFRTAVNAAGALPLCYPVSRGTSLNSTHRREHQTFGTKAGDSGWGAARTLLDRAAVWSKVVGCQISGP